eukprot:2513288-Amphidinium_carterae.1
MPPQHPAAQRHTTMCYKSADTHVNCNFVKVFLPQALNLTGTCIVMLEHLDMQSPQLESSGWWMRGGCVQFQRCYGGASASVPWSMTRH